MYYIGIDIGTTHIKAAAFDGTGALRQVLRRPTPLILEDGGDVYDPQQFYGIVKEQLYQLAGQFSPVGGISVTGMAEAGLILNRETGMAQTAILPWFDKRTEDLAQTFAYSERERFSRTGLRNSFKYGIYKFLWLLEHRAADKEQAVWLSVCDYIAYRLSGELVTDPTFAARTYAYDYKAKRWDKEWLAAVGLKADHFPQVKPSGSPAGCLTDPELISVFGDAPVPVAIGGHDHVCAAYAAMRGDLGGICNSMGTAETYLGLLESRESEQDWYHAGFILGPYVDGERYFWMGNLSSSGQSVEWVRRQIQKEEIGYEEMNAMLTAHSNKPSGIVYLPYLAGMGTPYFDAGAAGALIGLKQSHALPDVLTAVIEGISYQSRWILSELYPLLREEPHTLYCVGGAVNSTGWMQTKADVLGRPVCCQGMEEGTVAGAVLVMLNQSRDREAADRFYQGLLSSENQIYTPDETLHQAYSKAYEQQFRPLAEMIHGWGGDTK